MTTEQPDIHTLTGAYAVDALPEDERDAFEQHLLGCDACRQEVAEFQATAARLGSAFYVEPPASLRASVMAEIDVTRQERPAVAADAPVELAARRRGGDGPPARTWGARLAVAASAVLIVAVGGLSLLVGSLNDRIAQVETESTQVTEVLAAADATLMSTESPDGGVGRLVASPSRGEAVFVADGMEPAPEDSTYELWLIGDEGAIPAGLFDPDESGRVTRMMAGDMSNASAIGVTVEPAGGSPEPTSEPIMVFELG